MIRALLVLVVLGGTAFATPTSATTVKPGKTLKVAHHRTRIAKHATKKPRKAKHKAKARHHKAK